MRRIVNLDETYLYQIWSAVWNKLEFKSKSGSKVKVIYPGKLNRSDGADFKDARVKIDNKTYVGDVEIHVRASDWRRHGHYLDERYNTVVLHVALVDDTDEGFVQTPSGRDVLTVEISGVENFTNKILSSGDNIRCYELNWMVGQDEKLKWIRKLGLSRLIMKSRRMGERLLEIIDENFFLISEAPREYLPTYRGYNLYQLSHKFVWEQLLYEGIMEGLGYSRNQQQFRKLAKNLSLRFIYENSYDRSYERQIEKIQSLIFGASGFLDILAQSKLDHETRLFVEEMKGYWDRIKNSYRREIIHYSEWKFSGVRPSNFPVFKMSGAAVIIWRMFNIDFFSTFNNILLSDLDNKSKLRELIELLRVNSYGYWETHFNFGGKVEKTGYVVGSSRAKEIVVNTFLPIMVLFARVFRNTELKKKVFSLYKNFPKLSSNWITRKVAVELFDGRVNLSSGVIQQGTIQLYKFYCSNAMCSSCEIGRKLKL